MVFSSLFSTGPYRLVSSFSLSTPPFYKLFVGIKVLPAKLAFHNG